MAQVKKTESNRWLIWTLIGIAVILLGTAAYISISSEDLASSSPAVFVVHHPKMKSMTTHTSMMMHHTMIPAK